MAEPGARLGGRLGGRLGAVPVGVLEIDVEVAPGHRITGARTGGHWFYSCSCDELAGGDTEDAQAHAQEVCP